MSQIPQVPHAKMIQYGDLRGFLIHKGTADTTLLWQVEKLNPENKACAQNQLPSDHRVLIIEKNMDIQAAQNYLSQKISPQDLICH